MRSIRPLSRYSFGVKNAGPWRSIFTHSLEQFHENDLFTAAAAMSYFGLMSLFPALLLLLAIGNQIAGATGLLTQVVDVYPGSRSFLRDTIRSLTAVGPGTVITCLVIVLWAGSWVFAVIERALNRIWRATSRTFLHGRALTIGMIGVVGLVLTFSVLVTSIVVALREIAANLSPRQLANWPVLLSVGSAFWQVVFTILSFLVTVVVFVMVYRFMPKAEVTLRDTLPGAIVGAILWELAKYIFAWSLNYFHYDQIYGSVGAVVAVLTWSYVSSLILLFGAQLTAVFHREHPHYPTPKFNSQ
ncbi:MAG TPA: YihY/virulence factor BrkB family protein [Pyrinomonadaceae bacterium]|nr:YihY/virulence factor BrkB family protein [Pyrinomonadaceae bacterium]